MKMNLWKISKGAVAALICTALLAGCGSSGSKKVSNTSGSAPSTTASATTAPAGKAINIRIGATAASTHPMIIALKNTFKKEVEDGSKGLIKVEIREGGVLGGEKELYDSVRVGNLEMCAIGSVMWSEVPKMAATDFPFVFRDLEHARKVYTGDIGKEIAADVEKIGGVHFLSWHPNGLRVFSSNKTIKTLNDFKGLRLRMPNNEIHIQVGKLLGANVTPLPVGEVFTALEQKVVDGQDNPIATVRSEGWYEVQTDIYESNHMVASFELLGSDKMWKSLTDDQRKLIQDAAQKASADSWDLYAKSLKEDRAFLESKGIKFTTPDDATRQKTVEMMKPLYDGLNKKYTWAEDMIKRMRDVK